MTSREIQRIIDDDTALKLLFEEAVKAYEFFLPTRPIPALMADLLVADAIMAVEIFVYQKENLADDLAHAVNACWAIAEAQGIGAVSCFMENIEMREFYKMEEHGRSMVVRAFLQREMERSGSLSATSRLIQFWHHTPTPAPSDIPARANAARVGCQEYEQVRDAVHSDIKRTMVWCAWGRE